MRLTIGVLAIAVFATSASAQSRSTDTFQQRRLFTRLFDPGRRLPSAPVPPRTALRERPANPQCETCGSRPRVAHVLIDSPLLTDDWLARHAYQSNGGAYGDNEAIADFWYDAVHRRIFTRSLVLQEVADPADLRLGRAPGSDMFHPDFNATLEPGTTVGHVGFVRWSSNGFGSYFAAMQGAVRDRATGYLDLSTVTGSSGRNRSGSTYDAEDLIKHVRLHPTGQLEIGFDTDPTQKPETSLLVRGNVHVEGALTVDAAAPPPALSCSVRTGRGSGRTATVQCDAGRVATGGGGACGSGEMRASRPVLTGDTPIGWEVACSRSRTGQHVVYVICCGR
jgi:hypothetical protein